MSIKHSQAHIVRRIYKLLQQCDDALRQLAAPRNLSDADAFVQNLSHDCQNFAALAQNVQHAAELLEKTHKQMRKQNGV